MNGEWAQVIALVAHGNYFLKHKEIPGIDLSSNSTFQYANAVTFRHYKNTQDVNPVAVAGNVNDWFDYLRVSKIKRLWFIGFSWDRTDLAEHIAVSFAGGTPIAIQTDFTDGYELWYPSWSTGGEPQKPWFIEYRGLKFQYSHVVEQMNFSDVKTRLGIAIQMAEQFARQAKVDLSFWSDHFSKASSLLNDEKATIPYHPDMLPVSGFSTEARQILAAASQAYVFGGMGSWNDLGFEEPAQQKEYQEVTKTLFQAVKMATLLASNSFAE